MSEAAVSLTSGEQIAQPAAEAPEAASTTTGYQPQGGTENVQQEATEAVPQPQSTPAAGENVNWQDLLPENVRGWDEVKNSDSPEKFFGQMENLRSMMGKSIRIPTEDAGEEAMQAFMEKVTSVDGVMVKPKDADGVKAFLDTLDPETKRQAFDFVQGDETIQAERQQAELEQHAQEITDGINKLKDEWGNAFERNLDGAKNVVKLIDERMGDGRLTAALDATGAAGNPDMIAFFAEVAKMLGETPAVDGQEVNTFAISPSEAKERIAEIESNPVYWGKDTPEKKMLIAKRSKYYDIAYTGAPS